MGPKVGDIVLPGDIITEFESLKGVTLLGPGLKRKEELKCLIASRAGILMHKPNNMYWVETHQKRYIPKKGDLVVGIVVKKGGDNFKIDIGSCEHASLSVFAFEGATKKQRPDLQIGDAVYAKLLTAHREMEPELICIDKYFKAGILGPLSNDGFIINVHNNLAHRLLSTDNPLLSMLGKKYPFEVAIGMNGKIWINTKSNKETLNLMNALYAAQFHNDKDVAELCRKY